MSMRSPGLEAECRTGVFEVVGADYSSVLLTMAKVLRADAREAGMLAGSDVSTADEAAKAAADLVRQGPFLVALAVGDAGNLIAWPQGSVFLPLTDTAVADTTGAGDAFTAALISALAQGNDPRQAARLAAGATVGHLGGRPAPTPQAIQDQLALLA
jgi:ribokinase